VGSTDHSGSHRELLREVPDGVLPVHPVDAVIVPMSATAPYIRRAVGAAKAADCPLLVLCSKLARAHEVIRLVEVEDHHVDVIAVDLSNEAARRLPQFETTCMLAGGRLERRTDTSLKRNAGLAIARMVGWQHIVFLDDDIEVPEPVDLGRAVGLLGAYDAVGLHIGGFPDNSVVCHAHREAGGWQETFVGGGALAVPVNRMESSFFPKIYNEDWFFLLDDVMLRPVAVRGSAIQRPYDPFANPDRARHEEFGDTLAEGLFTLLDEGKRVQDATEAYWRLFIGKRWAFIADVLQRVSKLDEIDPNQRARMIESLKAARGRLSHITPELCLTYLRAWRADRSRWKRFLDKLPSGLPVDKAISHLGLKPNVRDNRTRVPTARDW
jgi:hypothetical protein